MRFASVACALLLAVSAARAETIAYPSRDADATPIRAELALPDGPGPFPAAVLFHGCSGMWNRRGDLNARLAELRRELVDRGYLVLIPDSFRSRGREEVCTQPLRERPVNHEARRGDALGALAWLRGRPDVDPARIVAVGWSHGGSLVLNATNRLSQRVAESGLAFAAAVAFYPGCRDGRGPAVGYAPNAPVLVLMGDADDWTSPEPCRQIAAAMAERGEPFTLVLYPGAYHGFDGVGSFRFTRTVQGGTRTVTMATDPAGRADAKARLDAFLLEHAGR